MDVKVQNCEVLHQVPYESENKFSGVFFKENNETFCTVKGSLEKILEFSSTMNVLLVIESIIFPTLIG